MFGFSVLPGFVLRPAPSDEFWLAHPNRAGATNFSASTRLNRPKASKVSKSAPNARTISARVCRKRL
jgi:hypothetical protein